MTDIATPLDKRLKELSVWPDIYGNIGIVVNLPEEPEPENLEKDTKD